MPVFQLRAFAEQFHEQQLESAPSRRVLLHLRGCPQWIQRCVDLKLFAETAFQLKSKTNEPSTSAALGGYLLNRLNRARLGD